MYYKLFLDDFRTPKDVLSYINDELYDRDDWIIVRNFNEFTETITRMGIPLLISFDHDLADEHYTPKEYWNDYESSKKWQESQNYKEKTGYDCAVWLIEYCDKHKLTLPSFNIHSMNPVGGDNINNLLRKYILNKSKEIMENSDFRKKIFDDITKEREYQDNKWGTDFDSKNTINDWMTYINMYLAKATDTTTSKEDQRKFMVKVAALSIAALERFDENDGFAPRHYDE